MINTIFRPYAVILLLGISAVASTSVLAEGVQQRPVPNQPGTAAISSPRETRNDAQIAAILLTANHVDIDAGQFALARAHNPEVKAFAQQMIADHGNVNTQAIELVTKLGVTPQVSTTSAELKRAGDQNVSKLQRLRGIAFDRAYVNHEVGYHQAVLDEIDDVLIPDSRNAGLKALLKKVRPTIAEHLQHAETIKASLH